MNVSIPTAEQGKNDCLTNAKTLKFDITDKRYTL